MALTCTDRTRSKLAELTSILGGKAQLLIVMQDNPDPDSIAAAVALRKLANTLAQVQCSIAHGGTVGRAENRALVRYLNLNLRPVEEIKFETFDAIAIVDTQPGVGNNSLAPDIVPDIVIDHHPFRMTTRRSKFSDVRSNYGATATILLEYLTQAKIEPDMQLATALLYAIRSDTQDLGTRECSVRFSEAESRGSISYCCPTRCGTRESSAIPSSPDYPT